MRRFLGFVLLPALATVVVVAQTAQGARDGRRDAYLSRIGGMFATAIQDDFTTAGTLRESLAGAAALDVGVYRQGARVLPIAGAATSLPDTTATTSGWRSDEGIWVTVADGAAEGADAPLAIAVKPGGRRGSVASTRTLGAALIVFILALMSAWQGRAARVHRAGRIRPADRGPVAFALALLVAGTAIISGGVAAGEARRAAADDTREMATVATMARARGMLDDPVATQRWVGSDVVRIRDGVARTGDGSPPPAFAMSLPIPPEGYPASGTAEGLRWLVTSAGEGRTVLLSDPSPRPPLFGMAVAGTLLVLLGALDVGRRTSVDEPVRA